MNKITKDIYVCEEAVLHTDFSASPELLEEYLAEDFTEIDPQGKMQTRTEVISWLRKKDINARWRFDNFQTVLLSEALVLSRYHAKQVVSEHSLGNVLAGGSANEPINSSSDGSSKGSMHSSIWRKHKAGWQMVFHQTTKVQ